MVISMKKHLLEAATLVEADTEAETWKVRLISEGKGSSGIYSADLLENYGHAFNGAISFLNHPAGGPETRNFTEIAGKVQGEVWKERDENGKLGVYANWRPDEDHRAKLERYKDKLGLSIYISGAGEVEDDGEFHVREFDVEDPFKSVDVVIAAGRGGRFEITESHRQIYESARIAESEDPTVTSAVEKEKEIKMDELKAAVEALTAQVSALVAKEQTAQAEAAQAEADKDAGREAVEAYDAAVTAIDAAELPDKVVESLRKQAKEGTDVTPLIEQAKEMKTALVETLSESVEQGRDLGNKTETKFGAFK